MKKQFLAALVFLTSSSFAIAGGSEKLISRLNLDEAQSVEVLRIFDESKEQRKAIRQEAKLMMEPLDETETEQRREIRKEAKLKMKALKEVQKEQLSAILDDEQMAIIEEKMNKMHNKRSNHSYNKKNQDS